MAGTKNGRSLRSFRALALVVTIAGWFAIPRLLQLAATVRSGSTPWPRPSDDGLLRASATESRSAGCPNHQVVRSIVGKCVPSPRFYGAIGNTTMTTRSLTLVPVGPVTTMSSAAESARETS